MQLQTPMSTKLKERVCAYAGVTLTSLPETASLWLSRRVEEWVIQRTASDNDVRRAARELMGRFKLRQQMSANARFHQEQPHHHSHNHHHPHPSSPYEHQSRGGGRGGEHMVRSKTTEPTTTPHPYQQHHQQPQHSYQGVRSTPTFTTKHAGGSASVPLVTEDERTAAGSPVMSLRPQVVKRLQRLNTDAQFITAVEKENQALQEEQTRAAQAKRERQAAVRRDMEVAEALRLSRLEAERAERNAQKSVMDDAIEEARLAALDEKLLRKRKSQREKQQIEDQNRVNQQLREDIQRREAEENQRLRDYTTKQERSKLLQELEKSTNLKAAMASSLEEGRVAAKDRADAKRQSNLQPSPGFSTRRAGAVDRLQEKVHQRELLQSVACKQYEDIQHDRRQKLEQLDHSAMTAHLQILRREEEREQRDRERSIRLRAALVSSLDDELSHQRDRKRQEEVEKREMRRKADMDAADAEYQRQNNIRQSKRDQERRRQQMDDQLVARVERLIREPMSIKI